MSGAAAGRGHWLFSARLDLAAFGGSALLAALLLAWGSWAGVLSGETPAWVFLLAVVGVDVAHVWATVPRVYLDRQELARRPGLYLGTPLLAWVAGVVVHSQSPHLFWRLLAYVAVFHFIRQQYGWVALYRRRLGRTSRLDRVLDDAAIYSATLYPLLWWHAHLPREFAWFLEGDFLPGVPKWSASALLPVHLAILVAYAGRQVQLLLRGEPVSAGKSLVVGTTWLAWFGGIVVLGSDFAFTVTNVLIHGIPYLALTWVHARRRFTGALGPARWALSARGWPLFVVPLVLVAWSEEWLWDRLVWHEHAGLFPGPDVLLRPGWLSLVVPLLTVPQATHYVLDAFIWRVRGNPGLADRLGFAAGAPPVGAAQGRP